jgi:hypothetical protein
MRAAVLGGTPTPATLAAPQLVTSALDPESVMFVSVKEAPQAGVPDDVMLTLRCPTGPRKWRSDNRFLSGKWVG